MKDSIKKYLPYAAVIFAIYLIVPMLFRSPSTEGYATIAWYFIFPITAIITSAIYCVKYGLDFLFALIPPIAFLLPMFIFYGGFQSQYLLFNLLLLFGYLFSGVFGLFIGDLAFGDKRRKRESEEKAEAEEMMLKAKKQDELVREAFMQNENEAQTNSRRTTAKKTTTNITNTNRKVEAVTNTSDTLDEIEDIDDFDYDRYSSDIDKGFSSSEDEIDDILNEFGRSSK